MDNPGSCARWLSGNRRRINMPAMRVSIWFVVYGFAIAYGVSAILRHWHFNSSYDLAIYDQAVWHLSRFEPPASSFRGMTNLFGDHFHPVIVLFAPLFWVVSASETLLAAQAVLLAISIIPVFVYARDRLPCGTASRGTIRIQHFMRREARSVRSGEWWGRQSRTTRLIRIGGRVTRSPSSREMIVSPASVSADAREYSPLTSTTYRPGGRSENS